MEKNKKNTLSSERFKTKARIASVSAARSLEAIMRYYVFVPDTAGSSSTAWLLAPHILRWLWSVYVSRSQPTPTWSVCSVRLVSSWATGHEVGQSVRCEAGNTGWGPVPGM